LLFLINYQLCKEFPAFTPLTINDTAFFRIMNLYYDLRKMQIRESKKSEKKVIRKPAGDNWF